LASVEQAAGDAAHSASSGPLALASRRRLGARFWRLWWATGISASGDGLLVVALPLLAVSFTRDPLLIAGVSVTLSATKALASVPAGMAADRWPRRVVMVGCNLVSATVLGCLVAAVALGVADLAMLYLVAAVLAACDVTYTLCVQASCLEVVPSTEQLGTANARLMGIDGVGEQFLGPGLGGAIYAVARALPFALDSVSFVVSAALVAMSIPGQKRGSVPGVPSEDPAAREGEATGQGAASLQGPREAAGPVVALESVPVRPRARWMAEFRVGWAIFRRERVFQLLAVNVSLLTCGSYMMVAILVLYGERTLRLTPAGYGLFCAAGSVLSIVAAFMAGAVLRRLGPSRCIVWGAATCSLALVGMGLTRSVVVAVLVMGLREVAAVVFSVASITTRQKLAPKGTYARLAGIHSLMVSAGAPVGALLGGVVASFAGVATTLVAAGAISALSAACLVPPLVRAMNQAKAQPAG